MGDESMHQVEPTAEHHWLQKLVGNWRSEMEASMAPDQPPSTFKGSETVRPLGPLWTIGEGKGEVPGGSGDGHQSIMTLGYDPERKKFQGTFVSSMMAYLWVYDGGTLDAARNVLTLNAEGPNFTQDGMAQYHDIIEFVDDDHRVLKSEVQGPDGTFTHFMTVHYYRQK